jgi:ribose 5-phosphate isomerase B
MKVVIASDHGGFRYKNLLLKDISGHGYELTDLGAFREEPSDYPDHAEAVAHAILRGKAEKGILICGSGVGVSVAANKFKGIRAGVCHDTYSAHQCVEHDDVNVLCIGQRVIGLELA